MHRNGARPVRWGGVGVLGQPRPGPLPDKLYMSERRKGITQKLAAARAGMSERTARTYEQAGDLPSAI